MCTQVSGCLMLFVRHILSVYVSIVIRVDKGLCVRLITAQSGPRPLLAVETRPMLHLGAPVVYWLRSWTSNRRVAGSNPPVGKYMDKGSSCAALLHPHPQIQRPRARHLKPPLALRLPSAPGGDRLPDGSKAEKEFPPKRDNKGRLNLCTATHTHRGQRAITPARMRRRSGCLARPPPLPRY